MSNASGTPNASGFISFERDDDKLFHTKKVSTVGGFHLTGELEDESFELSVANKTPPGTYTYPDKKKRIICTLHEKRSKISSCATDRIRYQRRHSHSGSRQYRTDERLTRHHIKKQSRRTT